MGMVEEVPPEQISFISTQTHETAFYTLLVTKNAKSCRTKGGMLIKKTDNEDEFLKGVYVSGKFNTPIRQSFNLSSDMEAAWRTRSQISKLSVYPLATSPFPNVSWDDGEDGTVQRGCRL